MKEGEGQGWEGEAWRNLMVGFVVCCLTLQAPYIEVIRQK